jgi:hypothetical protein
MALHWIDIRKIDNIDNASFVRMVKGDIKKENYAGWCQMIDGNDVGCCKTEAKLEVKFDSTKRIVHPIISNRELTYIIEFEFGRSPSGSKIKLWIDYAKDKWKIIEMLDDCWSIKTDDDLPSNGDTITFDDQKNVFVIGRDETTRKAWIKLNDRNVFLHSNCIFENGTSLYCTVYLIRCAYKINFTAY